MLQFNSTSPAQPSPLNKPSEFMAAAAKQPMPEKKVLGMSRRPFAIVALVLLASLSSLAVLIAKKQSDSGTAPLAPTAPDSKPQAYVEVGLNCTLTFDIAAVCYARCASDADCQGGTAHPDWSCMVPPGPDGEPAADGFKRCVLTSNPESTACVPPDITPTITPTEEPTPTPEITPTETPIPTPTDVNEPTPTPPPGITVNPTTPGTTTTYTVVTTVSCDYECSSNSDCSNPSHICYNGRCRLDANPDDASCHLPSGQTNVVVNVIPTQPPAPVELPRTGPTNWSMILKGGFAALGIGAGLLLFL